MRGRGIVGVVLCLGLLALVGRGDEPKYPRVDAAVGYKVDPSWPKKPKGTAWGVVSGIAVDREDNVYVFHRGVGTPPVQVYAADGKFLRAWGEDHIKGSHHIRIDHDGNVWAADITHHQVMQFTPTGRLLRALGTKGVKGAGEKHFNMPTDMAVTPDGDVFVADGYGNARVVHFDRRGKFVKEWGSLGSKPGQFSIVHSIVHARGKLFVADRNNCRVHVYDTSGKLLDTWSNVVAPWGLHVTPDDELWVCGSSPMRLRETAKHMGCPPKDQVFMRFTLDGKLRQLWTVPKGIDGKEKPGELNWVHAIASDSKGNLYVGDVVGKRAQKFVREEAD
jgi:DNA-binding beta-propeller fold protein YncE